MGSHPLLLEDVKVYYSQRVWVHTLCYWKMSRSTTVNEYGYPLLLEDVKVYYSQQVWVHALC